MKLIYFIFLLIFTTDIILNSQSSGKQLPSWQEGYLDILHINTGRGNSAFLILPDGTTLLIDAGDISNTHKRTLSPRNCPAKPDDSKSPGGWISYYIAKVYPEIMKRGLDYAVITHFHDDHFGEVDNLRTESWNGYLLTGITEVGTNITIHKLIDRGFDKPVDLFSDKFRKEKLSDEYHIIQTLDNYKRFIDYAKTNGLIHEKIIPGSNDQIQLKIKPKEYPDFFITNVFANGKICNEYGDSCFMALPEGIYPGENPLSIGLKVSYGEFDYFTAGDISGLDRLGQNDKLSMEAQAAPIVGIVDVASLNHHGSRDSQSSVWVSTLQPSVWVQQNWSSDHPGQEVLNRITSKELYPEARDIYSLCMTETTINYIGEPIKQNYASTSGHIFIRVYPKGNSYDVFVVDDSTPDLIVKTVKNYKTNR